MQQIDKLTILLTTNNIDTMESMVSMYAVNALKNNWWKSVRVIIWGGSTKFIKQSVDAQKIIVEMISHGVDVQACKSCALKYDAVELLESLNVYVDYMGVELTHILKNDEALITL